MKFNKFLKECNQKEVFKKLSLYVVTSWVIIQVFSTIWEPLGLPKESVTILLIILLLGFPINVYLVWRFDLVKHESRKQKINKKGQEVPGKYQKSKFQKTYFSVLSVLSITFTGIVMVIIYNNFIGAVDIQKLDVSDKIAVEIFGNNTGDPKNDIIGKMTADWIIHGISENNIGQVISQKTVDEYAGIVMAGANPSRSKNLLKEYFKPGKTISGNFYQKDDRLLFQGSLIDANNNDKQISFKLVECDSDSPLDCIEQLKQLILGYLVMNDNPQGTLESNPPKFDAYQHVITARANAKDNDVYIDGIEKAIAADPEYFEPKLLEIAFYYNREDYHKSDSLLRQIKPNSNTTPRQLNLLNMYTSLLEGENRKVFDYIAKEYGYNKFDLETNQSLMVVALQYLNRPELVEGIFEAIPSGDLIIENCLFCEYRNYIMSMADIQLKKYDEAIVLLEETMKKIDEFYLNKPLSSAFIRSNKLADLDQLVAGVELKADAEDLTELYLFIGNEFLLQQNKEMANNYFNKVIQTEKEQMNSLAESYYLLEDYKNAELIFRKLHDEDATNLTYISRLASSLAKNQKTDKGAQMIQKMDALRGDFQFGEVDYLIAQYYAVTEDENKMFMYLLKSISQGNYYTISSFQNDQHFVYYFENEKFMSILNYWH
jgi:TolB-like protein